LSDSLLPEKDRRAGQDDSPDVRAMRALAKFAAQSPLTPALRTRLLELASGLSYRAIAERNGISLNTVKTEVSATLARLQVSSRHEIEAAVQAARRRARDGASDDDIYELVRLRIP